MSSVTADPEPEVRWFIFLDFSPFLPSLNLAFFLRCNSSSYLLHIFFHLSMPSLHLRKQTKEVLYSIKYYRAPFTASGTILSSPFFNVARWLIHWKEQVDRRLDEWRWLSGFTLMGSYIPPQPFSLIPSLKEEGEKMWWGKRLKGWDKDKENC